MTCENGVVEICGGVQPSVSEATPELSWKRFLWKSRSDNSIRGSWILCVEKLRNPLVQQQEGEIHIGKFSENLVRDFYENKFNQTDVKLLLSAQSDEENSCIFLSLLLEKRKKVTWFYKHKNSKIIYVRAFRKSSLHERCTVTLIEHILVERGKGGGLSLLKR